MQRAVDARTTVVMRSMVVVAALAGTAHAEAVDSEEPPAPAPLAVASTPPLDPLAIDHEVGLHWIGHAGLRFGSSRIDGADGGTVTELLLAGGVRLDRLTVLGEYGLSLVHHEATTTEPAADGMPPPFQTTDGVMHRLGVDVRYAFVHGHTIPRYSDHDQQLAGELYVQAGTGVEIIQWDLGGRLVRPDVSVAIGMLGAYRTSAARRQGWFVDLRVQVARRIDRVGAEPTCSAPCTAATPPVAWSDRTYLLETGFVFGR